MATSVKRSHIWERTAHLFETESLMVMSTAMNAKELHTSTMLFAVDDEFSIYCATHAESLKAQQLNKNPNTSGVMWSLGHVYAQWRGTAQPVTNAKQINTWLEKLALKAARLKGFWPPIFQFDGQKYTVYKITPSWMRVMDLDAMPIHSAEPKTTTLIGTSYEE